jgi:hypothetical protein
LNIPLEKWPKSRIGVSENYLFDEKSSNNIRDKNRQGSLIGNAGS